MPYPVFRPKAASQRSHVGFSDRALIVDMPYAALHALIRDHEALDDTWVELPVKMVDGSYVPTLVRFAHVILAGPECNA